jgi:hypothetical protein
MTTLINTVFISSNLLIRFNYYYYLASYLARALSLGFRLTANMIGDSINDYINGSIGASIGGSIGANIRKIIIFLISFMLFLELVFNIFIYQEFFILSCIPLISLKSYNIYPKKGLSIRYFSYKKLTNLQRYSFTISPETHNIIIGLCLGDLYIDKQAINPRLKFEQGLIHEKYLLHLYDLFQDYCGSSPKVNNRKSNPQRININNSIYFNTYSLPCFNYYYNLFYINGVKSIPLNIGELLTPAGLAYWAMDDGGKHNKNNFILCTNSFTLEEVQLLIKVLKDNFDLNCTIHKSKENQYRIYILKDSMEKFRTLVTPYFHESMMYKLIN